MKLKVILLTLVVLLAGVTVFAMDDPNLGTWKLNEAKSKFSPGSPKNHTVVYEMAGDSMKVIVDGVDGAGSPTHNEWTGKFDGKSYAVTGDPNVDMRSYRKINSRTMTLKNMKDGKTIVTGRIVIATDAKSRTLTTTARNAKGKLVTNTFVFDKQ